MFIRGQRPVTIERRSKAAGDFSAGKAEIVLNPSRIFRFFAAITLALAIMGTAAAWARFNINSQLIEGLSFFFLMDSERNIPTFYSFILFIVCCALLVVISLEAKKHKSQWQRHWAILAAVFFMMAFDEIAGVHERAIDPLRDSLHVSGWLYFAWVIPAWIVVAMIAVCYLRFVLSLSRPLAVMMVASGGMYIFGALVIEMAGGRYAEAHGMDTFGFQMLSTAEETFEMLGLSLFAQTLMRFLATRPQPVDLRLRAG